MFKKILITGANGFIAKNIKEILGKKYNFISVSRNTKYNILDLNSLLNIDEIDTVIHCAAKTFVPDSFLNQHEFFRFNFLSTLNVSEFCIKKNVNKIIFLNAYPYGVPIKLPVDENHHLQPHSPYNSSKLISEELLFKYLIEKTNVVSLRVFNIYGKHQKENFLIPTIINQAKINGEISLNDLRPKRDFLYVKDLVSLIEKIIIKKPVSGIYNVGFGKSFSIKQISTAVSSIFNRKIKLKSKKIIRPNEILDLFADISKVSSTFNWRPKYSINEGINDYLRNEKL